MTISTDFLFGRILYHNLDKASTHVYNGILYIILSLLLITLFGALTYIFEKTTEGHFLLVYLMAEMAIISFIAEIVDEMLAQLYFGNVVRILAIILFITFLMKKLFANSVLSYFLVIFILILIIYKLLHLKYNNIIIY